jgi:hypothetical protein
MSKRDQALPRIWGHLDPESQMRLLRIIEAMARRQVIHRAMKGGRDEPHVTPRPVKDHCGPSA